MWIACSCRPLGQQGSVWWLGIQLGKSFSRLGKCSPDVQMQLNPKLELVLRAFGLLGNGSKGVVLVKREWLQMN
ncbi:hypothetical protein HU200_060463 [Digitaria exilis]|uniref:Uncharacterized protein n=1 Tax=Digitaria exilis TaxID=1010633 RepID=A0A835DXH0_9POAL|nr:hypothetical protein HU200_060463 [Digitaria exilis]